jgi:hypothetical protein
MLYSVAGRTAYSACREAIIGDMVNGRDRSMVFSERQANWGTSRRLPVRLRQSRMRRGARITYIGDGHGELLRLGDVLSAKQVYDLAVAGSENAATIFSMEQALGILLVPFVLR